jgi:ElaB/YqjD/DUF883 family membrane-anchored ribosome-binding protein
MGESENVESAFANGHGAHDHEHDERGADDVALADVMSRAKEAVAAATMLRSSAADVFHIASRVVRKQLEEHPTRTLGIAAGVGFVVAGGLATPTARTVVRTGARLAIGLAARQVIAEAVKPQRDSK